MAYMAYCRFSFCLRDLEDCHDHMDDDDLSEEEAEARRNLITLCKLIATYAEKGKMGKLKGAYNPS